PAEVGLGEAAVLDHGAHGAVEQQDALGEEFFQAGLGGGGGGAGHEGSSGSLGGTSQGGRSDFSGGGLRKGGELREGKRKRPACNHPLCSRPRSWRHPCSQLTRVWGESKDPALNSPTAGATAANFQPPEPMPIPGPVLGHP